MTIETHWCPECGQAKEGVPLPGDNAMIREFVAVIGLVDEAGRPTGVGRALVLDFYGNLLRAAPALRPLFPADILEATNALDSRGLKQRESLLGAILAMVSLFNPGDAERLEKLDAALTGMGQSHTRWDPPAMIEEYGAVTKVLLDVFRNYAQTSNVPQRVWEKAYRPALRRSLEYVSGTMLRAQALHGAAQDSLPRPTFDDQETAVQPAIAEDGQ